MATISVLESIAVLYCIFFPMFFLPENGFRWQEWIFKETQFRCERNGPEKRYLPQGSCIQNIAWPDSFHFCRKKPEGLECGCSCICRENNQQNKESRHFLGLSFQPVTDESWLASMGWTFSLWAGHVTGNLFLYVFQSQAHWVGGASKLRRKTNGAILLCSTPWECCGWGAILQQGHKPCSRDPLSKITKLMCQPWSPEQTDSVICHLPDVCVWCTDGSSAIAHHKADFERHNAPWSRKLVTDLSRSDLYYLSATEVQELSSLNQNLRRLCCSITSFDHSFFLWYTGANLSVNGMHSFKSNARLSFTSKFPGEKRIGPIYFCLSFTALCLSCLWGNISTQKST